MKRLFIVLTLLLTLCTVSAQQRRGVPATPYPIDVIQPNGDTLTIRLIGDEHYHYRTTLDGYLIQQNSRGYYCYAYYTKKGAVKASCRKAHNADKRTKREIKYINRNIPNKQNP